MLVRCGGGEKKEIISSSYLFLWIESIGGRIESIGGTKASTVGVANPYRYRGYRYDAESGLYYLQNRYYNSEWGRFINTDALAGQAGELLSHNIFAYCKNNPINMSDDTGFMPAFDSEKKENAYYTWKETKRAGGTKSTTKAQPYVAKKKTYDVKGAVQSIATSTAFSVGAEATLGHTIIHCGKTPMRVPVKLSTFKQAGDFLQVVGVISLAMSIADNFSGKYSKGEAWTRTVIDAGAFVAGAAFTLGGGWAAVGIGLGIGAAAEVIKFGASYCFNRKVAN